MPPHSHQLRRRTWCERACMTRTAARNSAFTKPVPQSAPCAHRVCPCSPASPTPRSHTLPGHPSFRPHHQFVASHVRPNPSLSRDPTRQAAWASWRAGLCCTTPPKRLTARVAVSSNVRPHMNSLLRSVSSSLREAMLLAIGAVAICAAAAIALRLWQGTWPPATFGLGIVFAAGCVWWAGRARRAREELESNQSHATAPPEQKSAV
jgi:hypothetical protein